MKFSWTFVWSSNLHPLPPLLPSVRHSHVMPGQAAAGGIRGQMMCWSALRLLRHRALRTAGYWPNLLCGILITYYLLLYSVRRYYKAYNQISTIHTDCITLIVPKYVSFQLSAKNCRFKTLSNIYVLPIVWILFIWGRYCDCCATNIAMLVPVSVSQLARYYHEDPHDPGITKNLPARNVQITKKNITIFYSAEPN